MMQTNLKVFSSIIPIYVYGRTESDVTGLKNRAGFVERLLLRMPASHVAVIDPIFVVDRFPGGKSHDGGFFRPGLESNNWLGRQHNTGVPDADLRSFVLSRPRSGIIGMTANAWASASFERALFHEIAHSVDTHLGLILPGVTIADFRGVPNPGREAVGEYAAQAYFRDEMGSLVEPVPWNEKRRLQFDDRWEAARQAGQDAFWTTKTSLQQLLQQQDLSARSSIPIRPVIAYSSEKEMKAAIQPQDTQAKVDEMAFFFQHAFLVPDSDIESGIELLRRAVDLAKDPEYQKARRALYDWQEDQVAKGYTNAQAIQQMKALMAEYDAAMKRAKWKQHVVRYACFGAAIAMPFAKDALLLGSLRRLIRPADAPRLSPIRSLGYFPTGRRGTPRPSRTGKLPRLPPPQTPPGRSGPPGERPKIYVF